MTEHQTNQLFREGIGVATACHCHRAGVPFVLVAASEDDLREVLEKRCGFEREDFDSAKFKRVRMRSHSDSGDGDPSRVLELTKRQLTKALATIAELTHNQKGELKAHAE